MKNRWQAIATWSGGIDSTAVLAQLLKHGYEVWAFTLEFYRPDFCEREARARQYLLPHLMKLPGKLHVETRRADWIWNFSHDGIEIPRRNKHILDHLIITEAQPRGITNLAMGEYVGADSWVVKDHVSTSDADHRALSAYLYLEYGLSYRLISLQDFGESRFKHERLRLGIEVLGAHVMAHTTNCLVSGQTHCGECYKCVERAVAWDMLGSLDLYADYVKNPRESEMFARYQKQMKGE